jgi:hypothetical protein
MSAPSANHASVPDAAKTSPGKSKRIVLGIIPLFVLALWFCYLWFVSGVLTSEEKYPGGATKARGYVKRSHFFDYKRHGAWTTFYPNGEVESRGRYEMGEKVGSWEHWDQQNGTKATSQVGSRY